MAYRIGVDLGGADLSPLSLYLSLSKDCKDIPLCLYVPTGSVQPTSSLHQIVCSSDEIRMDDVPVEAVSKKKTSTLMKGLLALKEGEIQAFVSLGNTGALVLGSLRVLNRIQGVHGPALVAHFPSPFHEVAVLDLGAFPKHTSERLQELIRLGRSYARVRFGLSNPRIGLLNIGHEAAKGTLDLREADMAMKGMKEYVGFVEPVDIFKGTVDVAITDGFTGNVLLKTAEGVQEFLSVAKTTFTPPRKVGMLLGIQGDVYKCHGRTTSSQLAEVIKYLFERQELFFAKFQNDFLSAE